MLVHSYNALISGVCVLNRVESFARSMVNIDMQTAGAFPTVPENSNNFPPKWMKPLQETHIDHMERTNEKLLQKIVLPRWSNRKQLKRSIKAVGKHILKTLKLTYTNTYKDRTLCTQ